ncbi:MAG: A/G-specific adenine glycosylase [Rhodospirillaceae bacterium]|nr:A/G-specific adenine glycosylase [Rhodospirillaceae bacterium]
MARRPIPPDAFARALLGWYDRHRRHLPWRAERGRRSDPYRVWLSEIMLQQTTVVTVGPYFLRFLERWPSIDRLAAASLDEVLQEWQGLGYYARARNLHRCARVVTEEHGGRFPDDEAGLRALPGIGLYTSAAIAAIAFDRPATVVDGNVERVVARLYALETPLPAAKPELRRLAADLTPDKRPGDFAQAMMDLGALICVPSRPNCAICPVISFCAVGGKKKAGDYPRRAPRKTRPLRQGVVFWVERADGAVLLRRRAEAGLLGGLMEFPSTPWREEAWTTDEALAEAPLKADWQSVAGLVSHGFTHFELELGVLRTKVGRNKLDGVWVRPDELGRHALPTLMRRVAAHMGHQVRPERAAERRLREIS